MPFFGASLYNACVHGRRFGCVPGIVRAQGRRFLCAFLEIALARFAIFVRPRTLRLHKEELFLVRSCIFFVQNDAVFWVRPWILPLHRDTVFVCIPCDSACTGTKFLTASFSNLCEQRRHFPVRPSTLCLPRDAVFRCVCGRCAYTGTPFEVRLTRLRVHRDRCFWLRPSVLFGHREVVF
jgi:hypothetical protein